MCGIVGYVGSRNCTDVLINGLTKLEYRGYDSAGIAVFSESGNIQVAKSKGRLADLIHKMEQEGRPEGHAGIGHTRWATHGEPSDINSHPHTGGRVTIVHNGIIENYAELKENMLKVFATFENAGKYRIDDFKYVTVTPGATADKIIRSIRGDVMTQGEFLDIFVEKLFTEVFTPRAEVYAAQDDIQELVLPLIGTYPDQWETVKQSLAVNAKDNMARLISALLKGEDSAVAVVADIFLDTMRDAGITEYNASQVKEMVRPLVKMLMKIVTACPDEMATLLYNIVGIMSAHYGELGMSWMLSIPADYMSSKQSGSPYEPLPFNDVPDDAWYRADLVNTYERGLINGTGANTFTPNAIVTRAQVVTVLYRMAGSPSVVGKTCPFTDNTAAWSRDAITWAYSTGVAKGYTDTRFAGTDTVTREQLASFLYRYADKIVSGGTLKAPISYAGTFSDAGLVSDYAVPAMRWANVNGIITGKPGGLLDPLGGATRAEFAVMISRFVQL